MRSFRITLALKPLRRSTRRTVTACAAFKQPVKSMRQRAMFQDLLGAERALLQFYLRPSLTVMAFDKRWHGRCVGIQTSTVAGPRYGLRGDWGRGRGRSCFYLFIDRSLVVSKLSGEAYSDLWCHGADAAQHPSRGLQGNLQQEGLECFLRHVRPFDVSHGFAGRGQLHKERQDSGGNSRM